MGTKFKESKMMKDLRASRTRIVEPCLKVQKSVYKRKDGVLKLETEVIEIPCKRIDGNYCSACAFPNAKWRNGECNLASHLYYEMKRDEPRTFLTPLGRSIEEHEAIQRKLNPIKASKRTR